VHQDLDNLLDQNYWYGTRPAPDFRALTLSEITRSLFPNSALLFYALSNEPDFAREDKGPEFSRVLPGYMCVWLLSPTANPIESEITLDADQAKALINLADTIRVALTGRFTACGWFLPDISKLFPVVMTSCGDRDVRPGCTVLEEASRLLLPEAIRSELLNKHYRRLIIVPSRNFGTIPYAALPGSAPRSIRHPRYRRR
jgi:hypothetical protein